jgi:hypothetical protein
MHDLQPLETRRFLSAPTIHVTTKGTLLVTGTSVADKLTIGRTNANDPDSALVLTITGGSEASSVHARQKVGTFQRISIDLGAGDDLVSFVIGGKLQQRTTIMGGAGNDTLEFVSPGRVLASGGDGNDVLFSQITTIHSTDQHNREIIDAVFAEKNKTGAATLLGNAGDDTLWADTNDSVDGASGSDVGEVEIDNSQARDDSKDDALAEVFYGRLGAVGIEDFKGEANANAIEQLPVAPTQPVLFPPGQTPVSSPSPIDPNPPPSPIDFPPSSPIDF